MHLVGVALFRTALPAAPRSFIICNPVICSAALCKNAMQESAADSAKAKGRGKRRDGTSLFTSKKIKYKQIFATFSGNSCCDKIHIAVYNKHLLFSRDNIFINISVQIACL
jgi:hypothetical protein